MLSALHLWLNRLLQAVSITLLLSLLAMVVAAVIMRKAGQSLVWYDELASVLLAWLTYYGAALAALQRAHLGFPGLLMALPPALRASLFFLAEAATVAFFVLAGYFGWKVLDIVAGEALVSLPWLGLPLVHSVIPIGAALFVLAQLVSLPKAYADMRAGRTAEDEEIADALAETAELRAEAESPSTAYSSGGQR
ncbi:MAG: TRAP transporter small permease [Geminicoccaceae bacterium]